MDVIQRIKEEHDEFRKMLEQLSMTGVEDVDVRRETYPDLVMRVDAHERAEERLIYDRMKDYQETRELALEMLEEHRVTRVLMVELRNVTMIDPLWLPKIRMIKELMIMHMRKEEELALPAAQEFLGDELEGLAEKFEKIEGDVLKSKASGGYADTL